MGAAAGEEEGTVRAGSIVWVRRKNGIWWPGRVMGPGNISPSDHHQFSCTATRAQIKLLGRDNASVDWYNVESSKLIKAFRCGEFDDCIRKAESSKECPSTKNLKFAYRRNAILHALDLERQLLHKKLKRPGDEMQQETCSRVKRRKSQGGASCSSESSVGPAMHKRCKHKRKLSIQQICRRHVAPDDGSRSCVFNCKGDVGSCSKGTLIDVPIKVLASHRGVDVPLVSMMSRLNGKAIIGHPVNIEALEGTAETRATKGMSRIHHLVWKTSKRTPVIYSPPFSSTREDKKMTQACESSRVMTFSKTDEFPPKSCKRQQSSNWSRKVFHEDNLQMKDGTTRGEALLQSLACVPVKHIFSKLLAAVSSRE